MRGVFLSTRKKVVNYNSDALPKFSDGFFFGGIVKRLVAQTHSSTDGQITLSRQLAFMHARDAFN